MVQTETVRTYYVEYEEMTRRVQYLEKLNAEKDSEIARVQQIYEMERKEKERALALIAELERRNKDAEARIEALKKEVARLHGITEQSGTNSGIPTSKTPLHKEKPESVKFTGC